MKPFSDGVHSPCHGSRRMGKVAMNPASPCNKTRCALRCDPPGQNETQSTLYLVNTRSVSARMPGGQRLLRSISAKAATVAAGCSSGLTSHGRATGRLARSGAVVIQPTVGHEPCSRPARCRLRRRHRAGRESIGGVASSQVTTAPGRASRPVALFQPRKSAAAPVGAPPFGGVRFPNEAGTRTIWRAETDPLPRIIGR